MTGNICRCSNYNHYVEAVLAAAAAPKRPSATGSSARAESAGEARQSGGGR
jgi:hypothetical protein